jgi:phage repressor protein C with HTH and peptisase S24 domain
MTMTHHMIRERLRQELDRRGLSAVELARQAGVKTSFLYDILNGKSTNPSTVRLAQVADSLGVSLAWLAGASDNTQPQAGSGHAPSEYISVPQLRVVSSAVQDEKGADACYFRRGWISETLKAAPEQLRMVCIRDDSMQPSLADGDAVLIDTARKTPSPPGIFILFDGLALVAKRLEYLDHAPHARVRVLSDNPQYGAYERSSDAIAIIGRVIWFSRAI